MLFIPTAGNVYDNTWWTDKDRTVLQDMGFRFSELDIATIANNKAYSVLKNIDVVFIAGGNTFYLLDQIRKTGFDKIISTFIKNGGLCIGASAGALILGPDIEIARDFDDPEHEFDLPTTGLGVIDFIPMPHYDMSQRTEKIDALIKDYSKQYEVISISDDEAIIVSNDGHKKVNSPRSKIELEWPKS